MKATPTGYLLSRTAFGKPYTLSRDDNAGTTHNVQFWYDPERSRYKQVVDGTQHLYLAGGTFEIIHAIGGVDTTYRMAIVVAGQVIGQLETGTNGTSATRYFYRDVLGSVTVIADSQGTVTQRLAYGPYGTHRDAQTGTSHSVLPPSWASTCPPIAAIPASTT